MSKKKILVIDDESNIRKMLKTLLELNNYQVELGENGKDGIEKMTKVHPDLVLLDLVMPELTGYQVLEKMNEDESLKSIPVILFTAAPPDIAVQAGSQAIDAVDYVLKPFDRMTLNFLLNRIGELTQANNDPKE